MGGEGIERRQRREEEDLFESDCDEDCAHLLLLQQQKLTRRSSGLSKYYPGKSQSYTCLSAVRSVEDLPKKEVRGYCQRRSPSRAPSCASFLASATNAGPPIL
ncbi:uncharacterized protein LOC121981141 [Zingiber officinale]|uniref:uncharacterized protein LOC121981141 n=1 Tax=Zingiber officinale TaxID=94328 RepID=UPI001C4B7C05|nr:uncharacterized protein LOC121981141 [Zingiber officinale]